MFYKGGWDIVYLHSISYYFVILAIFLIKNVTVWLFYNFSLYTDCLLSSSIFYCLNIEKDWSELDSIIQKRESIRLIFYVPQICFYKFIFIHLLFFFFFFGYYRNKQK